MSNEKQTTGQEEIPTTSSTESEITNLDLEVTSLEEVQLDAPETQSEPVQETLTQTVVEDTHTQDNEARQPIKREFGINENIELTKPCKEPLKNTKPLTEDDALSILSASVEELNALAEQYPNVDFTASEDGARWLREIQLAQQYILRGKALAGSLERQESLWRQFVTSGAEQLTAGKPKFTDKNEGGKLVGEQAMMRVQSLLGVGSVVRIPLWHTGIWVTFKAPTEAALLELDRRISAEKIVLGRQTNGLIYSNSSIYSVMYIIDFALAHIFETSVKYNEVEELKSKIVINDIPILIWGLLCSIYPNGYPFKQPCPRDPTECRHVTEELLNISKLCWTDDKLLSEWQRRQMIRKTAKFTEEELVKYREEHSFSSLSTVDLGNGIALELKVPTIEDYAQSGFAWVDGIVKKTDQAFSGTMKGEERNRYITEQGQMTALRQYAHWVNRIVLEGNEVIDDRNTIEDLLGTLTSSEETFKTFFDSVQKFIDSSTISLIAIPKYDCPACGTPMSTEEERHPHLIVLDVAAIFFTLLAQRIIKVLIRRAG